jgi:hypothetical protein
VDVVDDGRHVGILAAGIALATAGAGALAYDLRARASLPGDEVVLRPQIRTDHALTIAAPLGAVWPWLTQMGWHLGGYYTPHWVDRLVFPQNWRSLDHLDPALLRDLRPGDRVPDGPPGRAEYVVTHVRAPRLLVLTSTSHVPPGWAERYGARLRWTWTFALTPLVGGRTRVHLRVRGAVSPWWVRTAYRLVVVPADRLMAPAMLHGIARRAASGTPPRASGRAPLGEAATTS